MGQGVRGMWQGLVAGWALATFMPRCAAAWKWIMYVYRSCAKNTHTWLCVYMCICIRI